MGERSVEGEAAAEPESIEHELYDLVGGSAPTSRAATIRALETCVKSVTKSSLAIRETIVQLDEALAPVDPDQQGSLGSLGVVGLPIVMATRALRRVADEYVKEKTGKSLRDWTGFIGSTVELVDEDLELLERLGKWAGSSDTTTSELAADLVADVRWHMSAWKQLLDRVAQLSAVVEAMLAVTEGPLDPNPESAGGARRLFSQAAQKIQDVTADADLRDWLLRPIAEVRDRVVELPGLISHVRNEVVTLELLLDLVEAQIAVRRGEATSGVAVVVGARVATVVILPQLMADKRAAKERRTVLEAARNRLHDGRAAGEVSDGAYVIVDENLRNRLEATRVTADLLDRAADRWKLQAPELFDQAEDWVQLQLEVLAGYEIAEELDVGERRERLVREETLLIEAKELLTALDDHT